MPVVQLKEVRTLTVPLEAAVDAVLELDRAHGGQLARAKVMEARIDVRDEACLLLTVRHATAGAPRIEEKRYALPAVAAAVIHYCSCMEVPLPRRAAKSIEVVPEGFEFKLASATELQMRHGEVPCKRGAWNQSRSSKNPLGRSKERKSPADPTIAVSPESELSEATAAIR